MSLRTRRYSDGIKKWHPGQYDEKRFQGWKTLTRGFAVKVLESTIKILDCDGCELNEAGRKHILDKGMEVCFERGYNLDSDETAIRLAAIRLVYEAEDDELV